MSRLPGAVVGRCMMCKRRTNPRQEDGKANAHRRESVPKKGRRGWSTGLSRSWARRPAQAGTPTPARWGLLGISRFPGDGFEASGDGGLAGAGFLPHHLAVAQEYERRPQLDAEGPAQRLAGAVLDLDVPHP